MAVKGHAHGTNQHWYRKVDGLWKFAGLAPEIKWGEFDFDKIFESGRDVHGEEQKREEIKNLTEVAAVAGLPVEPDFDGFDLEEPVANTKIEEKSSVDAEAIHTASGGGSELEKLPVQVTAQMMQSPDEVAAAHNSVMVS